MLWCRFDKNIMALAPLLRARQEIDATSCDVPSSDTTANGALGSHRLPINGSSVNGTNGCAHATSASSVPPTVPLNAAALRPLSLDLQCVRPTSSWGTALKQVVRTVRTARGDCKRFPGQVTDLSTVLLHVPGADLEVRHAALCVGLSLLRIFCLFDFSWNCFAL